MRHRGVDRDDQVESRDGGRGVGEIAELRREIVHPASEARGSDILRGRTDLQAEPVDAVNVEQGSKLPQGHIAQDAVGMRGVAAPYQAHGPASGSPRQAHRRSRFYVCAPPGCRGIRQAEAMRQAQQGRLCIDLRQRIGGAGDAGNARGRLQQDLEGVLDEQPNLVPACGQKLKVARELKCVPHSLIVP